MAMSSWRWTVAHPPGVGVRHEDAERRGILEQLLGTIGEGSWIMPRFQCDYGHLIRLGRNSFLNYDAIVMDCAPVVIGDDVWLGGGVIVCPGVTIGANSVLGAGSVVTKDVPPQVFAAGNPCRVIRRLEEA
jgi:maltose O-acetyltransferase